jgi:DNA (cytosine-5)-methyltransferase 1
LAVDPAPVSARPDRHFYTQTAATAATLVSHELAVSTACYARLRGACPPDLVEAGQAGAGMIEISLDRQALLARIDELLEARYRSADLGNLDDPLAETVYILLSQQTQEPVYRRLFADLRRQYPRWVDVLAAPETDLIELLQPGGFFRQRAAKLKKLLASVESANQERRVGPAADPPRDLTLDFLREIPDAEAEKFLCGLPGIGPKSARCVLSYSLQRATFAVDTHVHRVFTRLGLVESNGRKQDHDPFQDAVPAEMRKRLHVNLVHHGRAVCTSQRSKCGKCVLVSFCGRGRELVGEDAQRPVAVDLFAGAGGMGRGFRDAGFRVALAVEANRHAAQTYRLNNPGVPVVEAEIDETTTAAKLRKHMPGVGTVHTLVAGAPCQGYSAAGARNPDDPQNALYKHVARLARQLSAETICLENVPGVRRVNGHGFLDKIIAELELAAYVVAPHLLRACAFGVPQHRLRYFFLCRRGRRREKIEEPVATHRAHGKGARSLPKTPRLEKLLADLPEVPAGTLAEYLIGEGGREYLNMSTMAHSLRVIRKIERIRPGEGPISYRRLESVEARTLIAGHRAMPVHPTLHRTISVREAAIIQGFPLDYFFCGPRAEQPLQVANAVPPPLAEAVARQILACLPVRENP